MSHVPDNAFLSLLFVMVVLLGGMSACTSLPVNPDRPQSTAITGTGDTLLGRVVSKLSEDKGSLPGYALPGQWLSFRQA